MRIPRLLLFFETVLGWLAGTSNGWDQLLGLDNSPVTGLVFRDDSDILLVTQNSSVSLFKMSVDQTRSPEKIGGFPATPDDSSFLSAAHVINDTHFAYCGEFRCSICSASAKPGCSLIDVPLRGTADKIGVVVINTTIYISSAFATPTCVGTIMEVVRQGKRKYLVEWTDFVNQSHGLGVLEATTYSSAEQDTWRARQRRHFPMSGGYTATERTSSGFDRPPLSRKRRGFGEFEEYISSETLLLFDHGDYAFVLKKRLDVYDDHLILSRYEADDDSGIFRRDIALYCFEVPRICEKRNTCYTPHYHIPSNSIPKTATIEGDSLFVSYVYSLGQTHVQFICSYSLITVAADMKNVSNCGTIEQLRHCATDLSYKVQVCSNGIFSSMTRGVVVARFLGDRQAKMLIKGRNDEQTFYFTNGYQLCRAVHTFWDWKYHCFLTIPGTFDGTWYGIRGTEQDDFSNLPFFAHNRRRNMMILRTGNQVNRTKMSCENVYRTCSEHSALIALKEENDEDCVWCARNGTLGHAILYDEKAQCEGVIIVDVCPPIITKVTRDGSTYYIDGSGFDSFTDTLEPQNLVSIHVCEDMCKVQMFGKAAIACSVETSYFQLVPTSCNIITLHGKIRSSDKAASAYAMRAVVDYSWLKYGERMEVPKLLKRYFEYNNGALTLVHPIEDVTTKKHRRTIIATIGLLMFSLCVILSIMIYIRVRQYTRRKEWETQEDKLEYVVEIDRGSFGVVSCAKHDGAWVAVKKLFDVRLGKRQRQFENEIWLLKTLGMRYRHPHVVRLLWVVMKPEICIITELCHGSLYNEIHDYWRDFSPATILDFCTQIASGMKFLHSKGVIHRDLKSGNVLMADSDGTSLKLCDFGLSIMKSARMRSANGNYIVGSLLWMAPEILAPTIFKVATPYTFASDVYAFGICVYELITSRLPYRGYLEQQIVYQVGHGTLQPDYRCVKDGPYFDVLRVISEHCINYNRGARPSFERICSLLAQCAPRRPNLRQNVRAPLPQIRTFPNYPPYIPRVTNL